MKIERNLNASIVMATYNGEKYIREQLNSIIPYMLDDDELIITDDGSSDKTIEIVYEYAKNDKRIKILDGPKKGIVKNFENGLYYAKKDIIFLADQDDIWFPNKIGSIKEFFLNNDNISIVLHDMYVASNIEINNYCYHHRNFIERNVKHGIIRNTIYSGYYGCSMAISQQMKNMLMPFVDCVNMHDQWIGLIGECLHVSGFIDEPLIIHRVHGENVSKRNNILNMIKIRILLILTVLKTMERFRKKEGDNL